MEKQGSEESSIQFPWIPQTPVKPIAPICSKMVEEEAHRNQVEERRFVGNSDMSGLNHLSFGDLLALAETTSICFSGQTPRAHNVSHGIQNPTRNTEVTPKCDEAVESLSSVSNNVAEEIIKTPEKPKRRKHRPKVLKDAKPKREPKPRTSRKTVVADASHSNTPKRKYVRKKAEVNKVQQSTPVESSVAVETTTHAKKLCKRALDFEPETGENQSNSDTKLADETESARREKQLDSGNQESKKCLILAPSTPNRKRSQSKRKLKELKNTGGNQEEEADISIAQAAKRRQRRKTTCSDIYLSGIQYDELFEYQKMHWLYFPNLQQEGMSSDAICSTSFAGQHHKEVSAFDSECYNFMSQPNANRVLTIEDNREGNFQERQQFEFHVLSDKIDTPIKKRTTGHAQSRNVSSKNELLEVSEQLPSGSYSRPQQKKNKSRVGKRVAVNKKKPSTKSEKSQTNQKTLHPNFFQFPPIGLSPDELWKQLYSIEAISEDFRLLNINRVVPYSRQIQGNEIVPYGGGAGAIVPVAPAKKHPRPKVDLDNETDRVWNLLLENINSDGVDGSDEKNRKWWEEERNVFRGRADSFIARMHLVQGDRRFTPWKGSVVDSVVGVFLTQNVSDHLSSSAFMSLAAKFPVPLVPSRNFDVGSSSLQITYLDPEESMSNPPDQNQSSVILKSTQPDEEKDYVDSNGTSRSSSEIASSAHESVGKTTDSKTYMDSDRKGSSAEVEQTDQKCLVLFPSEDSALTCQQHPTVSHARQITERAESSSEINLEEEYRTSYMKLLEGLQVSSDPGSLQVSPNLSPGDCSSEFKDCKSLKGPTKSSDDSNEPCCCYQQDGDVLCCQKPEMPESSSSARSTKHKELVTETLILDVNESTSCPDVQVGTEKSPGPDSRQDDVTLNAKGKKVLREKKKAFKWDSLRTEAQAREGIRKKTARTMDTVDWEAIRTADVNEVAETIKSRGMNLKLAVRIQGFLNRLLSDHGSLDLEWLRDVPPDKAKEYLLSVNGLGLKSVECVRLLTLHHLAFPVDTNVGRIAVRLGWVPLQPLPESLQLHLLEMYPVLESIQKYLWPRLCKLDQKTLYELHYQMITFGKVFCTKSKPNCNACPMRGECRHFASAFASARLALPSTEKGKETPDNNALPLPEPLQREHGSEVVKRLEPAKKVTCDEPIIEVPASPEPESAEVSISDIEDAFFEEDPEEIPTIKLNMDAFTSNLKKIMEDNKELQDGDMSRALVALTAEAASIPMPKLKNISQLRTEHQVYLVPDGHHLTKMWQLEKKVDGDRRYYLLAIWTPGETADSIRPAVSKCMSQANGKLCDKETCYSCNNLKEQKSQTVRGTILIPCKTALKGSFPLNGTYFQVNEVFADHATSLKPLDVPRGLIWDLEKRTVYFGTSVSSIFKGLSTEQIQKCFWNGFVCVRGFDRKTRAPKPLIARLHFPASKKKSQTKQPNPSGKAAPNPRGKAAPNPRGKAAPNPRGKAHGTKLANVRK